MAALYSIRPILTPLSRLTPSRQFLPETFCGKLPPSSFPLFFLPAHHSSLKSKRRLRIFASLPNNPSVASSPQETLKNVNESIRPSLDGLCFKVSGWQELYGVPGMRTLSWATDGRFCETFNSQHFNYTVAFDGVVSWRMEPCGRWTILSLDEREVNLISVWILTGFWLSPKASDWLQVKSVDPLDLDWCPKTLIVGDPVVLLLELHGGRVKACVTLDKETYLPQNVALKAYGGVEQFSMQHWLRWEEGIDQRFPATIIRISAANGETTTQNITEFKTCDSTVVENECKLPKTPVVRPTVPIFPESKMLSNVSPNLEVVSLASGHLLVKSKLNGRDMGFFLLDSGAGSLTLMPSVANELGLIFFGEFNSRGWQGLVKCCYRPASSFQLGPLEIINPLFVEMDISGIMDTEGETLAGICGFDVFASTVVEIGGGKSVSVFDPETYLPPKAPMHWMDFVFFNNVPVVKCFVQVLESSPPLEVFLMVDTGAGGVSLSMQSRAGKKINIEEAKAIGTAAAIGVGQDEKLEAFVVLLHSLKLGEVVIKEVETFTAGFTAGFDFSAWVDGVICSKVTSKFDVILDYSRSRIAFLPLGSFKNR